MSLKIEIVKKGFVFKKGEGTFAGWKLRYIKLSSNKTIQYYTDNNMSTLKGSIHLSGILSDDIKMSNKTNGNDTFGFMINDKKRKWLFCVKSENEMKSWIKNIRDVVSDAYFRNKVTNVKKVTQIKLNNKYGTSLKDRYAKRKQQRNARKIGNDVYSNDVYNGDGSMLTDEIEYDQMSNEQKVEQIQKRTDKAFDRAIESIVDTEDMARNTAVQLAGQRKQLIDIHGNLVEINSDLQQTDHTLKGMKSIKGAIWNKIARKKPKPKQYKAIISNKPVFMQQNNQETNNKIVVNKKSPTLAQSDTELVDEETQKLNIILAGLKTTQQITKDIITELEDQDPLLNAIQNEMDIADENLKKQTKIMNNIR
mmetsp:Transcript_49521/g.60794  ORF Transcript_49521/g.60794 Transcript_49521/m.60794 type:complete len:366 (+) Transcript_49521:218-1315(+)